MSVALKARRPALTLAEIEGWLKEAASMSPYGYFVPSAYARTEIGGLLGLSLTDQSYSYNAWIAYMRRARRALATRF
jgi:hypothetical protein